MPPASCYAETSGGILIIVTARGARGYGEPYTAVTVYHQAVPSCHAQTRERSTARIVAGGVDGIAHAVSDCHLACDFALFIVLEPAMSVKPRDLIYSTNLGVDMYLQLLYRSGILLLSMANFIQA